jgi:hypothetical protein
MVGQLLLCYMLLSLRIRLLWLLLVHGSILKTWSSCTRLRLLLTL